MRYGFWLPVFGGWLRNVDDEQMEASWEYVRDLTQRAEKIGYDLTLIAELNMNDIKGMDAVRPTFHNPALLAKQAASIDVMSHGRLTLNVVSSWWKDEATKYGVHFDEHDDRYARTSEWLDVVNGCWSQQGFSYQGKFYDVRDNVLAPKPMSKPRPTLYAGGESDAAKNLIAAKCDAYLMHGDAPAAVGAKIADMKQRREALELGPMAFGVAGYSIVRDSEAEALREVERITDVKQSARGYANYEQWVSGSQLQ